MPRESKDKNLPAKLSELRRNLQASVATIGVGSGGNDWLKVDDRNGALSVGAARDPFPSRSRYAVGLHTWCHGYLVFGQEGGAQRVMVPMAQQPVRPVPPAGYAERFGEPGARDATEIELQSLDEPGYAVTFTALGVSNANRVRALLEEAVVHLGTDAGQAGFIHPVIFVKAGHYFHQTQGREIFHFDYELVDWMTDGGDLWSKRKGGGGKAASAPWDAAEEEAA
jgi:hypothetical protein